MALKTKIQCFLLNDSGATAIEYALLASLLAVSAIPALSTLGSKLSSTFDAVAMALEDPPLMPAGKP